MMIIFETILILFNYTFHCEHFSFNFVFSDYKISLNDIIDHFIEFLLIILLQKC